VVDPAEPTDWQAKFKASQKINNKHVAAERAAAVDRAKAEHAMRNLVSDRDHWKERALKAEAALKSLGADNGQA
jgi:hypothetical protein